MADETRVAALDAQLAHLDRLQRTSVGRRREQVLAEIKHITGERAALLVTEGMTRGERDGS